MTSDARKTLAEFLQRELEAAKVSGVAKSEREWARKAQLPEHDVRRARTGSTGMTIDKLQNFADALGVEPWQLLFPGFIRNAPQFPTMSTEAIVVARAVDKIADDERRAQVAAGIVNLLGRSAGDAPASPPELQAEQHQPTPAPKRQPSPHR